MKSKIVAHLLNNIPKDVEIFVDLYADLVVRINELLREKGISKKELAEKLDKSPSEVSKWLGGEHNFTLRSLAKLSAELGEPLLEVPKRSSQTHFTNINSHSMRTIVRNSRQDIPQPAKIIQWQSAKISNPLNNVG